jgi:hypothetical protein
MEDHLAKKIIDLLYKKQKNISPSFMTGGNNPSGCRHMKKPAGRFCAAPPASCSDRIGQIDQARIMRAN